MVKGKVKWFNEHKGFGFISFSEGEAFVHYSEIKGDQEFKTLHKGQEVFFTSKLGKLGFIAEGVELLPSPRKK